MNHARAAIFLLVLFATAACTAGGGPPPTLNENATMISSPTGPFYSSDEMPASPKPPSANWQGVLIGASARTEIKPTAPMVVVNGTFRLLGSVYPHGNDALSLVAVSERSRQEFRGLAGARDPSPDAPPPDMPPIPPSELRNMVFSGHFNADLLATVNLPRALGRYRVWAELGPVKSNEVIVEISFP